MDNDTKKRLDKLRKELVRQQNSNNRVEGRASQDRAKKLLGIPDSKLGKDSDEEFWNSGNLRLEVKSGKQVSNTFSLFEKAETQSWDYEVTKDNPKELFSLMAMPIGTRDGLFVCRLSQIKEIVNELNAIWTEEKENGLDKK
jgi:hypothetical protein|tara:strand:+ start:9929 stop:10354 length:426 start_codon:yes stop_codon:yes gene_type:complete